MAWKSSEETVALVKETGGQDSLRDLFSLALNLTASIHLRDKEISDEWKDAVNLTDAGRALLELAKQEYRGGDAELLCAIFSHFFHVDLLIDHQTTEADRISRLVWELVEKECITVPYIHDRLLYDRFNDKFANNTNRVDHLESNEALELLKGTPLGVYQVGRVLTGPLGFIESEELRYAPPSSRAPLWHCSDIGCELLHFVRLGDAKTELLKSVKHVSTTAETAYGQPSEWMSALARLCLGWKTAEERLYPDMLPFLGSCVVGDDRTFLVEQALNSKSKKRLREALTTSPKLRTSCNVNAETLAARLSSVEQLQLLLVLNNSDIVALVDKAISTREIVVAPEEVRAAKIHFRLDRGFRTEASSLGVRAVRPEPLIRLRHLILEKYLEFGILDDLDWHIRRSPERTRETVLSTYIRRNGPESTVEKLILHEREVCNSIMDDYDVATSDSEEDIKDRLLWKLGFVVPRYGTALRDLEQRMGSFEDLLLSLDSADSEEAKEKIRGIGVNLFVSWEDALERVVAFCAWCFNSDHLAKSRFEYNREVAVSDVPGTLGKSLGTGDDKVYWDASGHNALGTLEQYLNRLAAWMEERLSLDISSYRREECELPHYADHADVVFPFRHTTAWADFDRREFEKLTARIKEMNQQIGRAGLSNIRNSIDHKRPPREFPTVDELLAFSRRMADVYKMIERYRLVPKRYWAIRKEIDQFGVGSWLLHDHIGKSIELQIPSGIHQMPKPQFKKPIIVGPGCLLGRHNPPLLFSVKSSGAYATFWSGYPRRRVIPPISDPESADGSGVASSASGEDLTVTGQDEVSSF